MASKDLTTLRSQIVTNIVTNTSRSITGNLLQTQLTDIIDSVSANKKAKDRTVTVGMTALMVISSSGGSNNMGCSAVTATDTFPAGVYQFSNRVRQTGSSNVGFTAISTIGGSMTLTWDTTNLGSYTVLVFRVCIRAGTAGASRLGVGLGSQSNSPAANAAILYISPAGFTACHWNSFVATYAANHSTTPVVGTVYDVEIVFDNATRSMSSYTIDGVAGPVPTTGQPPSGTYVGPVVFGERLTAVDSLMTVDVYDGTRILIA